MIYLTADQHYGHRNILRYVPERPFATVAEMDAELIRRHNKVVGESDTVIHLGDFAFGSAEQVASYLAQLNGTHIIVVGNHDRGYRALESLGFALAVPEMTINVLGVSVLLTHRPTAMPECVQANWHGHQHAFIDTVYWRMNLCVEHTEYRPIAITAALKAWRRKKKRKILGL